MRGVRGFRFLAAELAELPEERALREHLVGVTEVPAISCTLHFDAREETQNDACPIKATAEARLAWLMRHEALARRLAASDASSFPEGPRLFVRPLLMVAKELHPEVGACV